MLHRETWPVIDYCAHPAFTPHAVALNASFEQEVEALVTQANEALRVRYVADERLPAPELESWLERELVAPFERLRQACAAALPPAHVMTRCVDEALRAAKEDARAEARFRNLVAEPNSARMARTSRVVAQELREQSIVVGQIEGDAGQIGGFMPVQDEPLPRREPVVGEPEGGALVEPHDLADVREELGEARNGRLGNARGTGGLHRRQ